MVTMYEIATNMPETVGVGTFCTSAPGRLRITNVALRDPQGEIRVDSFAVRPNPVAVGGDFIGNTAEPLASVGNGFNVGDAQVVDSVCPTAEEFATSTSEYELAIQLTRLSGTLAGAQSIDISYESNGATRTLTAPYGFWLCSAHQPAGGGQDLGRPPTC